MPALPQWDLLATEQTGSRFRDIGYQYVPCNLLQIMENSVDPMHVEWLHGRLFDYHLGMEGEEMTTVVAGRHVRIGFDEFPYGIIKRRLREGQSEQDDDWRVGHPMVFPNILKVGGAGFHQFQIRANGRREHASLLVHDLRTAPRVRRGRRGGPPLPETYKTVLQDEDGRYLMSHLDAQDVMVWVTQGRIVDRTQENLCSSDRGVLMVRSMLEEQLAAVEAGRTP